MTDATHVTELLQCRQMGFGIHIWSIKLVSSCVGSCWLGVALASDPYIRDKWLGETVSGWAYGLSGDTHHNNEPCHHILPTYQEGSIVKFRLDLTKQGTLSASVDGGEEVLMFENMLMIGEEEVDRSFVPAVSLEDDGEVVRFLGFHRGG